jgi:transketolase C-terminal domain/subunit
VLIISSGILTMRALEVAQDFAAYGIAFTVLHSPTIKPLDETTRTDLRDGGMQRMLPFTICDQRLPTATSRRW